MRRWDVERVDLAALGKCGSRIGLVSARARVLRMCSASGTRGWAQLQAGSYFGDGCRPRKLFGPLGVLTDTRPGKRRLGATRARGVDPAGTMRVVWGHGCARVMRARIF